MGLSRYSIKPTIITKDGKFQCPYGLELLLYVIVCQLQLYSFNALMGLSCYGKNVQYFKFFMILFMHTCYL